MQTRKKIAFSVLALLLTAGVAFAAGDYAGTGAVVQIVMGLYKSTPATLTTGDTDVLHLNNRAALYVDADGLNPGIDTVSAFAQDSNGITAVALVSAGTGTVKVYPTSVTFANEDATAHVCKLISSGGTVIAEVSLVASTSHTFNLKGTGAASAAAEGLSFKLGDATVGGPNAAVRCTGVAVKK